MNDLMKGMQAFKEEIIQCKTICLVSHIQPDGDSLGSLLGLGLALRSLKDKKIKLAYVDDIPERYHFLTETKQITKVEKTEHFDLLVCLDCSDVDRLGRYGYLLNLADKVVNIDHHISNTRFGTINIVNPLASATGEIVFDIMKILNIELNSELATYVYVAISTDTGSFKYQNTTSRTHLIAAELLNKEIDLRKINLEIYHNQPIEKLRLLTSSLNTLELCSNNRIGMAAVTLKSLKDNNINFNDTEGIIDFIRDINTIEVACLLKEVNDSETKVSLRSKRYADVSQIAKKYNGGGHVRASGCTIFKSIEETKELLKHEIINILR